MGLAALIGWLWLVGGLLPLLGLLPAGLRSPHDRYAYVPIIGLFIAVVFGAMNVVGGYVVTDRMLQMFKKKPTAPKADGKEA